MSGMRVLDLFSAAAGGWSLGMHRAGFRTVAACESVAWRRALYSVNNPDAVIYDDVRTLTADRVVSDLGYFPECVVGSPPCQDISAANTKGKGVEGERSGLYFEAIRIVGEGRPRWFAFENSSNLRTRGADAVLAAMEALGYACWPFVVGADDAGANHERKRSWVVGFDASASDAAVAGRTGWPAIRSGRQAWDQHAGNREPKGAGAMESANADGHPLRQPVISGRSEPEAPVLGNAAVHAPGVGHEGRRPWRHGQDGHGEASASRGLGDASDADKAGREAGLLESSLRPAQKPVDGRGDRRRDDGQGVGEVGGCPGAGEPAEEPWADWNGGLAGHLRVDDGLSFWVAQSRIAVGGPKGTSAASLLVEAFGDAVIPQIPEAIGRAILRTEDALAAVYARTAA